MILSYSDRTSLTLVVKTRTPRHALPTILNFLPVGLSTYGFGPAYDFIILGPHFAGARSQDTHASTRSANHPKLSSRRSFNLRFWILFPIPGSTGRIVHYFLRNANTKMPSPQKNIINDSVIPIVSQSPIKKPTWISGTRNCSQNIRAIAYPIPIMPASAPGL